jgi:hypothetical protein
VCSKFDAAAAILLLGILAGPTFGALLAAPLFMP